MKKFILPLILLGSLLNCAQQQEATTQEPEPIDVIERVRPEIDEIVPITAEIQKLATGFTFTEGPVWIHEGHLLFSDIPNNAINRWNPYSGVDQFRKPSGAYGPEGEGSSAGSNGLTLDPEGRLIICEHGNRRITRLEKDGEITVLADRYEGKRLNSPNDAVYKSDGSLYFTDPPYGLEHQDEDPKKELDFNGIYRMFDGNLQLLYTGLTRPNGLAFSPDENYLYVANSDPNRKIWMRFEVQSDGSLTNETVFYDVTDEAESGNPDGMRVDELGNIYGTGPGGVWVFSPQGEHLGTIKPPEIPANCAWGDDDGKTLYMTARTGLYRINLNVPGIRP